MRASRFVICDASSLSVAANRALPREHLWGTESLVPWQWRQPIDEYIAVSHQTLAHERRLLSICESFRRLRRRANEQPVTCPSEGSPG